MTVDQYYAELADENADPLTAEFGTQATSPIESTSYDYADERESDEDSEERWQNIEYARKEGVILA
jgi:hypothetical protein